MVTFTPFDRVIKKSDLTEDELQVLARMRDTGEIKRYGRRKALLSTRRQTIDYGVENLLRFGLIKFKKGGRSSGHNVFWAVFELTERGRKWASDNLTG